MPAVVPTDRDRHLRALSYVLVALCLAFVGRAFLGFDQAQTIGYGVGVYVVLNLLNLRAMFARPRPAQTKDGKPRKPSAT